MQQTEKAKHFASLHVKGAPLVLYNIWDAGGARAITQSGAKAVATGSWSVAEAHGYRDGEQIPLEFLLHVTSRIAASVDVPLSIDFEGGYATKPDELAQNIRLLLDTGAVGLNFEDQRIGKTGLHDIAAQCDRIAAIRQAAKDAGVDLFINARTDLFLKEPDAEKHSARLAETFERAAAYRDAGASGFFVPGLKSTKLIGEICDAVDLPVNTMLVDGSPSITEQTGLGVARISCGPGPYRVAMSELAQRHRELMDG